MDRKLKEIILVTVSDFLTLSSIVLVICLKIVALVKTLMGWKGDLLMFGNVYKIGEEDVVNCRRE